MYRVIKSSSYGYSKKYSVDGWNYIVQYNSDYPETGEFDDMLDAIDMQITVVAPYDDAEYCYACIQDGTATLYRTEEIKTLQLESVPVSSLIKNEDAFDSIYDVEEAVAYSVFDLMEKINETIEPVIINY